MAVKLLPWLPLFYFLAVLSQSSSSPQNIQTFYPFPLTPPPPPPPQPSPPLPPPPPPSPIVIPLQPPPQQAGNNPPSSTKGKVAKAVVATAAGTVFVSALFFFLLIRYTNKKKEKITKPNPYADPYPGVRREPREDFARFNSRVKGVIVDEDGLDVLYWKRLEGGEVKTTFNKQFVVNNFVKDEEKRQSRKNDYLSVQERPLLRGMSSTSHLPDQPEKEQIALPPPPPPEQPIRSSSEISLSAMVVKESTQPPPPQIQSVTPAKPPVDLQEKSQFSAIPKAAPQPAPPPPIPKTSIPPPPPPINKKGPAAPPPPPPHSKPSGSKPPPPPPRSAAAQASSSSGTEIDSNGQVKMKQLHWDKVNPTNVEHSMVWHGLQKGSFKVDDDLMEALFGYVATNRKSPKRGESSSSSAVEKSNQSSQIFILDPRKSQNIAIVVRSLGISKRELVDSIIDGHGLNVETLERLTRIAPTREEETAILQFNGDPEKLADAESFLYHLLKSIPTAFPRLNAMLFRSNYVPETLFLKESLQTLEKACKELRTRGLFLKLLEAILKAGNRMNAGTTRGNAQAFNLSALRKLSDVKSIDGKTTLLYFVVEEVVRAEGKRCLINKSRSISRANSIISSSSQNSNNSTTSNQDKEKEYIMLGLPVVGGLSSEFGTVKKSATMDYDTLSKTYPSLIARLGEIKQILDKIKKSGGNEGAGGFAKEMKGFIELAEEELRVLKEEEEKVMELVKKTTDYYQTGNSKENEANPLHLFVIIKDFLGMVDQTCIEIARNMQKRRSAGSNDSGLSTSKSPVETTVDRRSVRFPKLPPNFMSEKSNNGSSESDDDDEEP